MDSTTRTHSVSDRRVLVLSAYSKSPRVPVPISGWPSCVRGFTLTATYRAASASPWQDSDRRAHTSAGLRGSPCDRGAPTVLVCPWRPIAAHLELQTLELPRRKTPDVDLEVLRRRRIDFRPLELQLKFHFVRPYALATDRASRPRTGPSPRSFRVSAGEPPGRDRFPRFLTQRALLAHLSVVPYSFCCGSGSTQNDNRVTMDLRAKK